MKEKIIVFCKKEIVLIIATVLAIISSIFVKPSVEYIKYIDWNVLGILMCLMMVMAGLQRNGFFDVLGTALLNKSKNVWQLTFVLTMLCFFLSMFITNDVALITFVPFTIITLEKSGRQNLLLSVVVLQTIAANLGSMLTPVGNPQNLYIYSVSGMSILEFMACIFPYTAMAFILIVFSLMMIKDRKELVFIENDSNIEINKHKNLIYLLLFTISLLIVAKVLPCLPVLILIVLVVFVIERDVIKEVDYSLLATFISFFIFIGNLANITQVSDTLQMMVDGREVIVSILASQFISNVPSALLLSGFTDNYEALLVGVNLGGLGTLIASMASLISYKIVANKYDELKGKYVSLFTIVNIIYLGLLIGEWVLIN